MSIIQTLVVGEGQGLDEAADDASSADTGAAFGQDDSEFNIFNTDRQLAALQTDHENVGSVERKENVDLFRQRLAAEWN